MWCWQSLSVEAQCLFVCYFCFVPRQVGWLLEPFALPLLALLVVQLSCFAFCLSFSC
jgi:hypothetical protein